MLNALTIDVEDYYQVSAFESVVRFEDWPSYTSRVEKNTFMILDLLSEYGVQATFFILGWEGEHRPGLVRAIAARGHEIACHGYAHRMAYKQTAREFREDVRRSKRILEDSISAPIRGYRAPSYSITRDALWCVDILVEEGFSFDSSVFPIRHDRYGIPNAPRFPYVLRGENGGSLIEFPLTTYRWFGQNIPVAGGGYLRIMPYRLLSGCLRRVNELEHQPIVVYFHPWEIDPEQPRLRGSFLSMFRHYTNLAGMEKKIRALLGQFQFSTMSNVLTEGGVDRVA